MGLRAGIVGLPNVGKSTLFNALTRGHAAVANYPFCTIDPNVGIVEVPDLRLIRLAEIFQPRKVSPATMEFVDIAGLVAGASRGEGLGNQFLAHIREVDAIVHIVRCFTDPTIMHLLPRIDPVGDIEIVETELILKDLETVERRRDRIEKKAKTKEESALLEEALLARLQEKLGAGLPASGVALSEGERRVAATYGLLSQKPVLLVANVQEQDAAKGNPFSDAVAAAGAARGAEVVVLSAKIESEIAELSPEEGALFLAQLGLPEPGLSRLIRAAYRLLGLLTFFTGGEMEVRAWTLSAGVKAPQAAGVIHSDFEKGFIRAEVVSFDDLDRGGSMAAVREKGLLRLEGREYQVCEGDIIYFRTGV